jgi:ribonuclease PH
LNDFEIETGTLSASLICASLALADAGIHTYDLIASCSVVHLFTTQHRERERERERQLNVTQIDSLNTKY